MGPWEMTEPKYNPHHKPRGVSLYAIVGFIFFVVSYPVYDYGFTVIGSIVGAIGLGFVMAWAIRERLWKKFQGPKPPTE